ncbi:MAG: biopolymer transporter ExbD [Sediminibacterium sp.]|nr:biopolymer transporter ExbD [Sediminibacterium sp.]
MQIRRKESNKTDIPTGALNDILFILLLFFLIVSTLANPNIIKVNNPKSESDTRAKQSVVISINKNQEVFIGSEKIELMNVEAILQKKLGKDMGKPTVVINGDSVSNLGTTIQLMQIIKKMGANPVLAVKRE